MADDSYGYDPNQFESAVLAEAEEQIIQLEQEKKKATQTLMQKERAMREQLNQIRMLQEATAASEETANSLRQEIDHLKTKLAAFRNSPKADPIDNKKYLAQINELESKNQRLNDLHKQLQNEHAKQAEMFEEHRQQIKACEMEHKKFDAERESMEKSIGDLSEENEALREQIEHCETAAEKLEELNETIGTLKETIAEQAADIDSLRTGKTKNLAKIKALRSENEAANLKLSKFKEFQDLAKKIAAGVGVVGAVATGVGIAKSV